MNVGVVGVGWWGKNIVNSLEQIEEVSKVVIFDQEPVSYDKFLGNKKTCSIGSLDELLTDKTVSAICLATPPPTHYDYSKKILSAGKHLLVEKPPAYDESAVRELGLLAQSKNLVYMLDALYLFLDPIQKLKQIVHSGELNDITYVQIYRIGDEIRRQGAGIDRLQRTMFANGIDVIEDLFFHDAAILLSVFGDFQYESTERLFLYHPSLCDTARIKLKAGVIPIELTLSWALAGRRRGMIIYDRENIIEYDGLRSDGQITRYRSRSNESETLTFSSAPPLIALLKYYLRCIRGEQRNDYDHVFMEQLTKMWRTIANER